MLILKRIYIQGNELTFERGKTINAPPPADSTIQATNFGFTVQNVESHEDLDTRILS